MWVCECESVRVEATRTLSHSHTVCYNQVMPLDITTVLFDLDGTLRHNHPNGYDIFIGFLQELGFALTPEQIHAGHRWTHYYWSIAPEMHADMREYGGEGP